MKKSYFLTTLICTLILMTSIASAARKKVNERPRKIGGRLPETVLELTQEGKTLEAKYAKMMSSLKAEIVKELPNISESKQTACLKALESVKAAKADKRAQNWIRINITRKAQGIKAKEQRIKDLPGMIADAKAALNKAKAMPDGHKDKADAIALQQKKLESWQKELAKLPGVLKKNKAGFKRDKLIEPEKRKQVEAAKKTVQQAEENFIIALQTLGLESLLSSDKLDAKIAKYMVLSEATPRVLAEFAQQGREKAKLVDELLSDTDLMVQMLVADSPFWEKFGEAMEIYKAIQKASRKAKSGVLQRLALAVSLEHAVPMAQRNAEAMTDAPKYVDPIKRYLSYEKAYLANELDPGFKDHSTWALRMVIDGAEPDHISVWGRKMLHNYRPDHISTDDNAWRYVKVVNTDVFYGSKFMNSDKPEYAFFQNVLSNGGICGRRAFFGRFILRAFGVPTTARSQPKHAALAYWTPDGWMVCLGAGWGAGNRTMRYRYKKDLDFLASTQARQNKEGFMKVKRAQWIGHVLGEKRAYGNNIEKPEFWHCAALIQQAKIIDRLKAKALEAVGTDIGEANMSEIKDKVNKVTFTKDDREITVDRSGVITIPAAATSKPTNNTDAIKFMKSNLGGMQLHFERYGGSETFEYTFDARKAGKYKLTGRVVTPAWDQHLFVSVNGAKEPVDIALPYTVGMWGTIQPVEINLLKGRNVLKFSRSHYFMRGVTIRDFKLVPSR